MPRKMWCEYLGSSYSLNVSEEPQRHAKNVTVLQPLLFDAYFCSVNTLTKTKKIKSKPNGVTKIVNLSFN